MKSHGFRSVNVAMRKQFDLYANVRPAKTYPGVITKFDHIDLVVVRENTEDLYAAAPFGPIKPNISPALTVKLRLLIPLCFP